MIARNTAFAYKGKGLDAKHDRTRVERSLCPRGQRSAQRHRVRVNVQLIEAEAGKHLWAERFDKPIADLFDMQDEIVARLANQLRAEFAGAEARRAEQARNLGLDGPLLSRLGLVL